MLTADIAKPRRSLIEIMFERLILAFTGASRSGNLSYNQDVADRKIVQSRSHGNIRLQQGRFYTYKDLDEKFNDLRGVRFTD